MQVLKNTNEISVVTQKNKNKDINLKQLDKKEVPHGAPKYMLSHVSRSNKYKKLITCQQNNEQRPGKVEHQMRSYSRRPWHG